VGEERRLSTVSAGAGGVVIVKVLGGGEGDRSYPIRSGLTNRGRTPPDEIRPGSLLAAGVDRGYCPGYTFAPVCTSFALYVAPRITPYRAIFPDQPEIPRHLQDVCTTAVFTGTRARIAPAGRLSVSGANGANYYSYLYISLQIYI